LYLFSGGPFNLLLHETLPASLCARHGWPPRTQLRKLISLVCKTQQPAWEISWIRMRYLIRVGEQLPSITTKINDSLPTRKLATFLLSASFSAYISYINSTKMRNTIFFSTEIYFRFIIFYWRLPDQRNYLFIIVYHFIPWHVISNFKWYYGLRY